MRFQVDFRDAEDKARYLSEQAERDSWHPIVVEAARPFSVAASPGEAFAALHAFVRDQIRYMRDLGGPKGTPGEELADAATVLSRRWDDCDGKARVFAALAHALARWRPCWHIEPRMVTSFRGADFVHVRAAVRFKGSDRHPKALPGGFVVSEPIASGSRFGDRPLAASRLV